METPLKNTASPLDAGDHPEMDNTDLLAPSKISIYQMMIGCLQWAVILGFMILSIKLILLQDLSRSRVIDT